MAGVVFYQLRQRTLSAVLSRILVKSRENGWRVVVRGTRPEQVAKLNRELWRFPKDGFLPHGMFGSEFDADQPILLSAEPTNINSPDALISIEGSEVTSEEVRKFKRVSLIFDGNDPDELSFARRQWRELRRAGVSMQYWEEEGGRWVQRANTANGESTNA